jgi:carbon storage regulator CsrA
MGLVLSRKLGESIRIGTSVVQVVELHRGSVKLRVEAPGLIITRAELGGGLAPLALEEDRSVEERREDGDLDLPAMAAAIADDFTLAELQEFACEIALAWREKSKRAGEPSGG